jgi:hypothetical protein
VVTLLTLVVRAQVAAEGLAKRGLLVQMTVKITIHLGLTAKVGRASPLQSEVRLSIAQAEVAVIGGVLARPTTTGRKADQVAAVMGLTRTEAYPQLMVRQTLAVAEEAEMVAYQTRTMVLAAQVS